MKRIFFFLNALNFMEIAKMQYKFQKMFRVFKIMAFEHVSGISVNYDQNTCWAAVNVLPNSPKISHLTKRNVFSLNCSWLNGKLGWMCCRPDFTSNCNPVTPWLSKGVRKRELLGIQVTVFLGLITSEIFKLWCRCFFSKCIKFYVDIKNSIEIWKNV